MQVYLRILFAVLCLNLCSCISAQFESDIGGIKAETYHIQCAQRQEISPCNCYYHGSKAIWIKVICQKMKSFNEVVTALKNKFDRSAQIHLDIEYSQLEDFAQKQFKEIESKIEWIWLHKNNLGRYVKFFAF